MPERAPAFQRTRCGPIVHPSGSAGVFCAMELEEWGGDVLPHEETMAAPVEDRLRLLRATHTHLSASTGRSAGPVRRSHDLLDE